MASPSLSTFEADAADPRLGHGHDPAAVRSRPSNASGSTHTSGSRSTARSRRCGRASSSRCSATGSTRSRSWRSWRSRPAPPSRPGSCSSSATLPNLLLSPIAGAFVDRWDRKEVMVVSDILRAAIVLLLPIAAVTNILLVYPLIFLVTTISVFFRPARVAILPRIVPEEDLLSANSAMWVGETIADVVGYPLAGVFVALLGTAVPLAFWLDSATYLASACLLGTIVVNAAARPRRRGRGPSRPRRRDDRRLAVPAARDGPAGQHPPGRGRPVQPRHLHRPDAVVRPGHVQRVRLRLAGRVRLPRDRDRARQPHRRVRHRAHRHALRQGPDGHRRLRGAGRPDVPVRAVGQPRRSRSVCASGRASPTWSSSSRARPCSRSGRRRT